MYIVLLISYLATYYPVGSKLLSTDLLVSIYLNPMMKAYAYNDLRKACTILYSFNKFFLAFKMGIEDLPNPENPDTTDIMERRNPTDYYNTYFEKYLPLISQVLGQYQNLVLQTIKDERGDN